MKALYRSWAIPCAGQDVYYTRHRSQWRFITRGEIFDHGEITSGQLAQHAYPGFAVVHGLEIIEP